MGLPILFAAGMSLLCLFLLIRDARMLSRIPRLRLGGLPANPPSVAMIIPARNEARTIARSAGGALRQTYPAWSLTVIDDHSTDATPDVLQQLFTIDNRLRILNSAPLPADWKGKCWACWQAAQATDSEWLLFLDADTRPEPQLLAAAMSYALEHQLDLLTVMPFLELGSFWERTILPAFMAMIQATFPLERVNRPGSQLVVANGQFMLIRRAAYDRAGGHRAVFDRVLEDVELAQAIVRSGGTMRAISGAEFIAVRMYTNGREVREGLTKNAIAGLRNGGASATWAGVREIIVALTPPALLLGWLWATLRGWSRAQRRTVAALALLVNGVAGWSWGRFMRRLYRQPAWTGLLFPLGIVCYMAIAAGAAWRIWRGIGVQWKGRTYRD